MSSLLPEGNTENYQLLLVSRSLTYLRKQHSKVEVQGIAMKGTQTEIVAKTGTATSQPNERGEFSLFSVSAPTEGQKIFYFLNTFFKHTQILLLFPKLQAVIMISIIEVLQAGYAYVICRYCAVLHIAGTGSPLIWRLAALGVLKGTSVCARHHAKC